MAAGMAACPTFEDSAGLQSLVDGIRAEMMVTMLEGLQGTAAACAEICLRRLEEQRRELLPSCEVKEELAYLAAAPALADLADTVGSPALGEKAFSLAEPTCSQEEPVSAASRRSGIEHRPSADHVEHFCMDMEDDGVAADSPATDEQGQAFEEGLEAEEGRGEAADIADLDAWYGEEASPVAEEPEEPAMQEGAAAPAQDAPEPAEASPAAEEPEEAAAQEKEEEEEAAAPAQDAPEPAEASPAAEEPEEASTQEEAAAQEKAAAQEEAVAPAQDVPEPAEAAATETVHQGLKSSDAGPADAAVAASEVAEAEQAAAAEAAPPEPSERPGPEEEAEQEEEEEEDVQPTAERRLTPVMGLGSGAFEHLAESVRTLVDAQGEADSPRTPEKRGADDSLTTPEKDFAPSAKAPSAAAKVGTAGRQAAGGGHAKGIASTTRWRVVGGNDSKGITVRMGRDLDSATLSERLSSGSVIRQLRRVKDRVHYELESGDGPATGWVSSKLGNGKVLLEKVPSAQPGLAASPDSDDENFGERKFPVAKTVQGKSGHRILVATENWQELPEGVACPRGLEYRMDMGSGKNFVRETR